MSATYWTEAEFLSGLTGACGPNAAAMGVSWAQQAYQGDASEPATVRFYRRMRATGRCSASGVSDGGQLAAQLSADGYSVERQASGSNWANWLKSRLAKPAVAIVELSRGQQLRDAISGQGEDASNLQFHFILACFYHPGGYSAHFGVSLPEGFAFADGDNNANNPIVGGVRTRHIADHRLQFYPLATLAAAQPVDLIAIAPRVALGGSGGGSMAGVPPGWSDDGTTLMAGGVPVVKGFRKFVLENPWFASLIPSMGPGANRPLKPEYTSASIEPGNPSIGAGSRQDFLLASLGYTVSMGVYVIWIGQDILALGAVAQAAQQQLYAEQARSKALQAKLDKVKVDAA
jgi:hypothetical protein